jgi:predicted RecA/RadA family phage recombinase
MKNFVQKGERITIASSALKGPNSPIKGGDPVVVGRLVGVAVADQAMPTQADSGLTVVQTKGVFTLSVVSTHHNITIGSTVYIDPAPELCRTISRTFRLALCLIRSTSTRPLLFA